MNFIEKIKFFLNKKETLQEKANHSNQKPLDSKSWYLDRYDKLIVQRNVLFVITVLSFLIIIAGVIGVVHLATSKQFEPFVIQIEEGTGVTSVVNPLSSSVLTGNDELAKYFIKRYVTARETYNPVDFENYARRTIRLMSSSNVYYQFLNFIQNKTNDPKILYGDKNTTYLSVKSWSKLAENKFMMRFAINEITEGMMKYDKIAVIDIEYVPMELTDEDKELNPIGFQVRGYRVDNDNS